MLIPWSGLPRITIRMIILDLINLFPTEELFQKQSQQK